MSQKMHMDIRSKKLAHNQGEDSVAASMAMRNKLQEYEYSSRGGDSHQGSKDADFNFGDVHRLMSDMSNRGYSDNDKRSYFN